MFCTAHRLLAPRQSAAPTAIRQDRKVHRPARPKAPGQIFTDFAAI